MKDPILPATWVSDVTNLANNIETIVQCALKKHNLRLYKPGLWKPTQTDSTPVLKMGESYLVSRPGLPSVLWPVVIAPLETLGKEPNTLPKYGLPYVGSYYNTFKEKIVDLPELKSLRLKPYHPYFGIGLIKELLTDCLKGQEYPLDDFFEDYLNQFLGTEVNICAEAEALGLFEELTQYLTSILNTVKPVSPKSGILYIIDQNPSHLGDLYIKRVLKEEGKESTKDVFSRLKNLLEEASILAAECSKVADPRYADRITVIEAGIDMASNELSNIN